MNLFYLMKTSAEVCNDLIPVWTVFGYIIFAIKIIVPLLLIVFGMITMAKAVMGKDDKEIKAARNILVQRLIAAVLVYLVITIVGVVINLVADSSWKNCTECAFSPFGKGCYITESNAPIYNGQ